VFIMGVGVAGCRPSPPPAARRGGHRHRCPPATKEQVESLGAKFLAVEDEEFKTHRPPAATPRR
jgi:NAD(P) transhydrogenase subunit alpha